MFSGVSRGQLDSLKYGSYYSEKFKIFYVSTPKVGCTSLKWWFAKLEGCASAINRDLKSLESTPELTIHDTFHLVAPSVTGLPESSLDELVHAHGIFRFAVVRNPYKRIFSAWQSKILLREPLQIGPYVSQDFFYHKITNSFDIADAFECFLEHLLAVEAPSFLDPHWTPQVTLLRPDLINYSNVSQLEDTSQLEIELKRIIGDGFISPFVTSRANQSLIPYSEKFITPRSAELIKLLYAEDFVTFNYSLDVPKGKAELSQEGLDVALKGISMIKERHSRISDFHLQIKGAEAEQARLQELQGRLKELDNLEYRFKELKGKHFTGLVDRKKLNLELAKQRDENHSLYQQNQILKGQNVEVLHQLSTLQGSKDQLPKVLAECLTIIFASRPWRAMRTVRKLLGATEHPFAHVLSKHFSFESNQYLRANSDVAAMRVSPEEHFLVNGAIEGRPLSIEAKSVAAIENIGPDTVVSTDFDAETYLALYPDVKNAGVDPEEHYRSSGKKEGRLGLIPKLKVRGADESIDPSRKTFLVVSHEASRTGAPILSLNIVINLSKMHNVIVLLLGGGDLEDAFVASGAVVVGPAAIRNNPVFSKATVNQLLERFHIDYAIANSIETRSVLPALAERFVPCLSLAHEFAAYTRPRGAFRDALFWSGEMIFSADVTFKSAHAEFMELNERHTHILPQGRCLLPPENHSSSEIEMEEQRIIHALRPNGGTTGEVVVLGAGFVQLRKGVDLFIECAARVVNAPGGRNCRFVWIGQGYDPDNDTSYSVYLADQLARANLEKNVFFISETSAIDTVYQNVDIFLLTSRLDPLPNVAIDALSYGIPIVCFDKTTGIADFLSSSGLAAECVAPYLDTVSMSEKVLSFVNSPALRADVSERSRSKSHDYFNMNSYINSLEDIAVSVEARTKQEHEDFLMLRKSMLIDLEFVRAPHQLNYRDEELLRSYIRSWASGIDRRKPFPGFHPGIYLEQNSLENFEGDPYVHFLKAGSPDGCWLRPVITPEVIVPQVSDDAKIALHVHVYYPDLLPEILQRLKSNKVKPDLFISVPSLNVKTAVLELLNDNEVSFIRVEVVPNRGRDIGPLLTGFGLELVENYEIVGHIHTKKTADVKDLSVGKKWFSFLLDNLLGGSAGNMADVIIDQMLINPKLGLVFPDDPYVVGWSANEKFAQELGLSLSIGPLPQNINFPVGTMFWSRAGVLAPLVKLFSEWEKYPVEPLPYDGSVLHALERIIPLVCESEGFEYALTNVEGSAR
ncbi:rhamnan synthesis F family protein [Pseudomonas farris]